MRFDEATKKMYLDRFYPGTTPEDIQDCTGFSIDIHQAKQLDPPRDGELRILRQQVDPQRLILGKK
jgi:glutaconate CoA-transferase subunit B